MLDLGTGLGHVAQIAGELVGPTGSVLGIDRSADAIAVARQRASEAGARHLTYVEGDARAWRASEPFDALVGRLLLFHVPDITAVVSHHLHNLRPGGEFVAIDFDIGGSRAEPFVPIVDDVLRWVQEAFRAVGSLSAAIVGHDIATAEQLDVATLEQRIAEAVRQADAVILLPTVVGAWGYSPVAS